MTINDYKKICGDKPGRFHIKQCNFNIPLWVEKVFLKGLRSKKFRHIKKRMKKEVHKAIERGMKYDTAG